MTIKQADTARKVLSGLDNLALHHGDCVGSDYQAHALAREMGHFVVIHPPLDDKLRAFAVADLERQPKPYLDRNKDVVDETEILVATPKTRVEELRSGTWATIRYAKKQGKPIIIIYPDGDVEVVSPVWPSGS